MKKYEEYIFKINSSQCQCGKRKTPKMSFCPNCFYRLPQEMKSKIHKHPWKEFCDTYDAAVEYLNK
jgi:hypothetical protein